MWFLGTVWGTQLVKTHKNGRDQGSGYGGWRCVTAGGPRAPK